MILAYAGVSTFIREYIMRPPRLEAHVGGNVLGRHRARVQNADPYTYFGERPSTSPRDWRSTTSAA